MQSVSACRCWSDPPGTPCRRSIIGARPKLSEAVAANAARTFLGVIGAVRTNGEPGFFMLSDRADASGEDIGASEEVLDHRCGVLTDRMPRAEQPDPGAAG